MILQQCRVRENDGRKLDHQTLEAMRLRAVDAVESGVHPEDVAASLGMGRGTVYGWLARYREGGKDALRARPVAGRPPKLSGEQMRRLYTLITDRGLREDVPSSVELRWRPDDHQAASTVSVWPGAPTGRVTRSSVSRRDRRCRWPLTRRNCLPASTIPAAHQRSAICPSRQRLTLALCARQMLIMLPMALVTGMKDGP